MEAETPRRWIRRPESRPPDGNDDGATELNAGTEIDVGSGRPTGARRVGESRNAVGQPRLDGAAGLTLTESNAGSGTANAVAAAIGEWEAVDGQAEARQLTARKR